MLLSRCLSSTEEKPATGNRQPATGNRQCAASIAGRRLPVAGCLLPVLAVLAGCPGDDAVCGFGDAPVDGIVVAGGGDSFEYGGFQAGQNNDCPAEDGVVSVTVFGGQVDPAGAAFVTLCLPRPDLIESGTAYPLTPDVQPVPDTDRVQVIDVDADHADDCAWSINGAPSGTASFEGLCADGADPAGFALTLDGSITLREDCPAIPPVDVEVTLGGTVRVLPQ
jgi:hypothetical protein